MSELILIDGTYELFRGYFAVPKARGKSGAEVGAVRGLSRSLASLLTSQSDIYVACAFDHVIESFRNELFDGYKTSAGVDADLLAQFELAERATRALGVTTWPMIEFEADDAMATAAHLYAGDPRLERVLLASPDKDLCQCVVDERVLVWDRMRDTRLGAAGVVQKFGVPPALIPDYLALVGDTADGIPGVPRWGAKSASALLAHYGSIEAIPPLPHQWQPKVRGALALAESLNARREDAALYRRLATLRRDVPIAESLEDLKYRGPDFPALRELCEELGDPALLERLQARYASS